MTKDEFNLFCGGLPATTHVVQWGGAEVWKVGGKVFAIGRWDAASPAVTFKPTEFSFEILKDQPGLRPAPYLASRGLKWIQNYAPDGLSDADLKLYLERSHQIVAAGLSRKKRRDLGLESATLQPG